MIEAMGSTRPCAEVRAYLQPDLVRDEGEGEVERGLELDISFPEDDGAEEESRTARRE